MTDQPTYVISNWAERFECAESRKTEGGLKWLAVPQQLDQLPYRKLMRRPGGPEALGVYVALAMIVGRLPKDGRVTGYIMDGDLAMAIDDMSIATDISAVAIERAIDLLIELGFMAAIDADTGQPWQSGQDGLFAEESTRPPAPPCNPPQSQESAGAHPAPPRNPPASPGSAVPRYETEHDSTSQYNTKPNTTVPTPDSTPLPRGGSDSWENSIEQDSGSDSGEPGEPGGGDDKGIRHAHRERWQGRTMHLWAPQQHKPRQHRADRTSAIELFERHIWPDGLPPPEAKARYERAIEIAASDQVRTATRPMAFLTTAIRKQLPEPDEVPA